MSTQAQAVTTPASLMVAKAAKKVARAEAKRQSKDSDARRRLEDRIAEERLRRETREFHFDF